MSLVELIIIAIALSMDSFAISLTAGVVMRKLIVYKVLKIAVFLAVFQAMMPVIGWLLGVEFKLLIESYDHWIAFAVLLLLGGKMVWEALRPATEEDSSSKEFDPAETRTLIGLSLATSIDALAIGVSFAFLNMKMTLPAIVIGCTTFLFALVGIYIGHHFGQKFKSKAELFGGVVLIFIGIKILITHLF